MFLTLHAMQERQREREIERDWKRKRDEREIKVMRIIHYDGE